MYFHFIIGKPLPRCPTDWRWTSYISYPSATFLFGILAIAAFIFATIIGFKYNSVRVFNRKIRTQNISNTMWILYYATVGCRGIVNAVRYALEQRHEESLDSIFFLGSLILHGITAFALSLALNHQRKYRSSIPPPQSQPPKENDPLLAKYSWCKRTITVSEATFFVLFVIYIVFLYLQIIKSDNVIYEILFLVAFCLQRFPVIVLVFLICIGRWNSLSTGNADGPTRRSKIYLATAVILNSAGDLPLTIWNAAFPVGCVFVVASWVDMVHLFYIVSLLFFFLFLRSEYLRNMEECIWTTVSQIQDTFDFRRF